MIKRGKMISEFLNQTLTAVYHAIREQIPEQYRIYVALFIFAVLIALYAILTWKFYKFLAKKNILKLNLSQYNTTKHPFWNKLLESIFFFLEYIIIMPLIVFFWFSVFSIFLMLMAEYQDAGRILFIAAALIAATRFMAYYSEELAEEIVGYIPVTLLMVLLLEPGAFDAQGLIERFSQVPGLVKNIFSYLLFVVVVEILLRGIFTVYELITGAEEN